MDLTTKLVESEDKYLRLFAEFENYKKRTQKEKEDLEKISKQVKQGFEFDFVLGQRETIVKTCVSFLELIVQFHKHIP